MASGNRHRAGGKPIWSLASQRESRRQQLFGAVRQHKMHNGTMVHQSPLPQRLHPSLELRSSSLGSATDPYVKLYERHFPKTLPLEHFTITHMKKPTILHWTPLILPNVSMTRSSHQTPGFMRMQGFKWLRSTLQSLNKMFPVLLLPSCSGCDDLPIPTLFSLLFSHPLS